MARRREQVGRPSDDAGLILPRELVEPIPYDSRENAERLHQQRGRRDEWLAEHGVGVSSDANRCHRIVRAAEVAHGIDNPHRRLVIKGS